MKIQLCSLLVLHKPGEERKSTLLSKPQFLTPGTFYLKDSLTEKAETEQVTRVEKKSNTAKIKPGKDQLFAISVGL